MTDISTPTQGSPEAASNERPQRSDTRQIWQSGLWHNHPVSVQLLGLCPLLAVSNTLINALGLGIATLFVLVSSSLLVSLCRKFIQKDLRIVFHVLIIASLVSVVDILMQAWAYELHQTLGLFIPLIVTNCLILGRAETFASRHSPLAAVQDGLAMGLGFLLLLLLLGGFRELVGHGSLLSQAHTLFGAAAQDWRIQLGSGQGLLIMLLAPGGFIALGLLLALFQFIRGENRV